MGSFGRRTYSETASCIHEDFVFQTPIIEVEGRDKFMKLQRKIDSNFILIITSIETDVASNVYNLKYIYQVHLHAQPKIEIKACAKIYMSNNLISKMMVEFEDLQLAETVFKQMIFH